MTLKLFTILLGMQFRAKTCEWGTSTCRSGNGYGQRNVSYCSGPEVEVCPLTPRGFGIFKEVDINGKKRILRSSPESCIRDESMVTGVTFSDRGFLKGIMDFS